VSWVLGALLVLLLIVLVTVLTRINVETGVFFIQPYWLPVAMLTALLGIEAIGPEVYIVLALASVVLVADPRELMMPFLANGLQMVSPRTDQRVGRISPVLGGMVVLGFVAALTVTLTVQYNRGANQTDGWAMKSVPSMPFQELTRQVSTLASKDALVPSVEAEGLSRWSLIEPNGAAAIWMGAGLVLVIGCTVARLRLPWWPLHPVLFLVWGTYPCSQFYFSFLLGWVIKAVLVKLAGARTYHATRPLMVGVIAGEMLAALAWILVGAIYYWQTGLAPPRYSLFPS
jgi:hypothetical protein